jgi:PKD repeat protein
LDFELEKLPEDIVDTPITDVRITVNRTNITQNDAIDFTGHAEDLDGDALLFYWLFDDGSVPTFGELVSHTFHDYGLFNVTLTVRDTDGNVEESYILIEVKPYFWDDNGSGGGNYTPPDTSESDDNLGAVIALLILIIIIVILITIFVFFYIQRRTSDREDLRRQERAARAARTRQRREKRRREADLEFVDREKQNVEQVNLIIANMHKQKSSSEGDSKRRGGDKTKPGSSPGSVAWDSDDSEDD